ncbi:MAG: hypothetical protein GY769_07910 [bacterium]|nr:hypothetical protein [bacterium]
MSRKRRLPHQRTTAASARTGCVRIRLLSGRNIWYNINGVPPSYLRILIPPEKKPPQGVKPPPGRKTVCKRSGLDRYEEMTVKEMVKAGLIKKSDTDGHELDKKPSPLILP